MLEALGKPYLSDELGRVLSSAFGELFPAGTLAKDGSTVKYRLEVDGREFAEASMDTGRFGKVPEEEIDRFIHTYRSLRESAADKKVPMPRENRRLIQELLLADPEKCPELYRVYRCGRKRQLLILWGLTKTGVPAIPFEEALAKLPRETAAERRRRLLAKVATGVLLLGCAILILQAAAAAYIGGGIRIQKASELSVDLGEGPGGVAPADGGLPLYFTTRDDEFSQPIRMKPGMWLGTGVLSSNSNVPSLSPLPTVFARFLHQGSDGEEGPRWYPYSNLPPKQRGRLQWSLDRAAFLPLPESVWEEGTPLDLPDGRHELSLLLQQDASAWDLHEEEIDFSGGRVKLGNQAPVICLDVSGVSLEPNGSVEISITDAGSFDHDGFVVGWTIDWGDGDVDDLPAPPQNVIHRYSPDRAKGALVVARCTDDSGRSCEWPLEIDLDRLLSTELAERNPTTLANGVSSAATVRWMYRDLGERNASGLRLRMVAQGLDAKGRGGVLIEVMNPTTQPFEPLGKWKWSVTASDGTERAHSENAGRIILIQAKEGQYHLNAEAATRRDEIFKVEAVIEIDPPQKVGLLDRSCLQLSRSFPYAQLKAVIQSFF